MLIKPIDDKSRRLTFLLNLYDSPMLNEEQKQWLDNELWVLRRNFFGEETSANFVDSCFAESEDYAVLHDLRLHLRDGAVRIDHLLLARGCAFVIETRHFDGNITIDERGNFTIEYSDGAPKTINAPLKRGQRIERNLREFFDAMDIKVRGEPLDVNHLVMFPNESAVHLPLDSKLDTSNIVKAGALKVWVEEMVSSLPSGGMLKGFSFGRASREKAPLREWGEKIASHHHPDNPFYLPKFIRLKSSQRIQAAADAAAADALPADVLQQQTFNPTLPPEEAASLPPIAAQADAAPPQPGAEAPAEPLIDFSDAPTEYLVSRATDPDEAPAEHLESHAVDLGEAPTEYLESHAIDLGEAPTEYLESHAVDLGEAPTEYLESRAGSDDAPTEFLAREVPAPQPEPAPEPEPAPQPAAPAAAIAMPAGLSTCAQCGRPLMRGMVKFCLEHPKRFGGQLYCFTHQNNFPPVPEEEA